MRLRAVALAAVAAGTLAARPARAADGVQLVGYSLRVEAGAEHDSNPARLERVAGVPPDRAIVASPALRLVSAGDLAAALGERSLVTVSAALAGKRFLATSAQPEDLIIAEARAAFSQRLGERWAVGLGAGYYDVFQRAQSLNDARDFRSVIPTLRLERGLGDGSIGLGGGWRWFVFKPERSFDFSGPTAEASYRQTFASPPAAEGAEPTSPGAQWDLTAGLGVEDRRFQVGRCRSLDTCPAPPGTEARRDRFWTAHAEATRTGALLLGAGLLVGLNDSNSYGEGLLRLIASLRGAVLLPWQLSLSGRVELVATRYREAVPVGHNGTTGMFVSVEDEGRSALRLELVRPLTAAVELGARYTFYAQTPAGGPVTFQRQLFLIYAAFLRGS
jgi:hypothetical protein